MIGQRVLCILVSLGMWCARTSALFSCGGDGAAYRTRKRGRKGGQIREIRKEDGKRGETAKPAQLGESANVADNRV